MEDRVRIYELARQMNLPNQELITMFRELGYDVKSHSSTVDSNAVGLLIARMNKKDEDPKAAKAAKPAAKTASKVPPPPPEKKKVKPRVLSRYRKADLEEAATAEAGVEPGSPNALSPGLPASGPAPLPASHISSTPRIPRPPVRTDAEPETAAQAPQQAAPPKQASAPAVAATPVEPAEKPQPAPAKAKTVTPPPVEEAPPEAQSAEDETDSAQPGVKPTGDEWSDSSKYGPRAIRNLDKHFHEKQKQERKRVKEVEEEEDYFEDDDTGVDTIDEEPAPADSEDSEGDANGNQRKAVRPMSPSVPIRVAAPSMRATPPRPPKPRHSHGARHHKKEGEEKVHKQAPGPVDVPKIVALTTNVTVQELSEKMRLDATEIIMNLFTKGIMRTVNQVVELETAIELALEMGYEVLDREDAKREEKEKEKQEKAARAAEAKEDEANLINRPPVVTIMGHVDHGKTSLLDAIRQTKFKITDEEAGGITQHIGAYHVEVEHDDGVKQIVFLDTPGHEAFTAMRARGAKGADIAVLVVAADDGVMPQTVEAIDHAKAAEVPIIVAVNKVDKPGADPDRVLTQLMEHELVSENFGGETVTVNVSAKQRTGLDELLDMILLVADLQDLRANPAKFASGVIVEAELSRSKGAVATALVQNGTLREGDFIVVGSTGGRVRALFDDRGHRVKAAGPSMPVEVLGIDTVPQAGDKFEVVDDIQHMKDMVEDRKDSEVAKRAHHVTLESLHDLLESGEVKELNVIIKADVQGTAEAIADSVRKLSGAEVQVRVLRAASGDISENDVNLAASSDAIVIGFNSHPDPNARTVAEQQGVDVRIYSIIYQITEDLSKAIQGLLEPIREEVKLGTAEIRQIFKVGKGLVIGGCMVLEGKIQRGAIARIERDGKQIYDGRLETLKRFKDDVREVAQGFECGMSFERFHEIEEGDKVNVFIIKETKRE
ncbi:MAG: translation initiation factor IF-2 [Candidatus Obscuribacterales bacterium]